MYKVEPKHFQYGAEHARDYWHVVVPNETPTEDLLKSATWVSVLSLLRKGALIDVVTPDGLLDMQLRVVDVKPGLVVLRPRVIYEDKAKRAPIIKAFKDQQAGQTRTPDQIIRDKRAMTPDGYKVGWNFGRKQYYVQQKLSGLILNYFNTDVEAFAFAIQHARAAGVEVADPPAEDAAA